MTAARIRIAIRECYLHKFVSINICIRRWSSLTY